MTIDTVQNTMMACVTIDVSFAWIVSFFLVAGDEIKSRLDSYGKRVDSKDIKDYTHHAFRLHSTKRTFLGVIRVLLLATIFHLAMIPLSPIGFSYIIIFVCLFISAFVAWIQFKWMCKYDDGTYWLWKLIRCDSELGQEAINWIKSSEMINENFPKENICAENKR